MSRLFCLFLLLLGTISLHAQVPNAFQFQALVRNSNGTILSSTPVQVRFKLHQKEADGNILFIETHSARTDTTGILNLRIGKGVAEHNSLSSINWADGPYFMEAEVDYGQGYISMGSQQLLCVPFAKHANSAENLRLQSPNGKRWNVTIDDNGNISVQEIRE